MLKSNICIQLTSMGLIISAAGLFCTGTLLTPNLACISFNFSRNCSNCFITSDWRFCNAPTSLLFEFWKERHLLKCIFLEMSNIQKPSQKKKQKNTNEWTFYKTNIPELRCSMVDWVHSSKGCCVMCIRKIKTLRHFSIWCDISGKDFALSSLTAPLNPFVSGAPDCCDWFKVISLIFFILYIQAGKSTWMLDLSNIGLISYIFIASD